MSLRASDCLLASVVVLILQSEASELYLPSRQRFDVHKAWVPLFFRRFDRSQHLPWNSNCHCRILSSRVLGLIRLIRSCRCRGLRARVVASRQCRQLASPRLRILTQKVSFNTPLTSGQLSRATNFERMTGRTCPLRTFANCPCLGDFLRRSCPRNIVYTQHPNQLLSSTVMFPPSRIAGETN
jgi:hypothetical protein